MSPEASAATGVHRINVTTGAVTTLIVPASQVSVRASWGDGIGLGLSGTVNRPGTIWLERGEATILVGEPFAQVAVPAATTGQWATPAGNKPRASA